MKHFLLFICLLAFHALIIAQSLIRIDIKNEKDLKPFFNHPQLRVHYYNSEFLIATAKSDILFPYQLLTQQLKADKSKYLIVWKKNQGNNIEWSKMNGIELYSDSKCMILEVPKSESITGFSPDAISLVHLDKTAKLPAGIEFSLQKEANQVIIEMTGQVNSSNIWGYIQHLQDYGTRLFSSTQAVQAQNWLKAEYESLGLSVSLQDFPYSPASSDNVIAIQNGTVFPDQYIVVGGHYDSYTFSGNSKPGADDNASGTAGVLEIARVLSQYQFNKSIIYCAFSAEEVGLVGSEAWVQYAVDHNLEIEAYLNLDMIGYLNPGDNIHTDIIAPSSADPLVEYYKQIVQQYVPGFQAADGTLSGGDSDHTSFNNAGIMGIFPFEDSDNYSPYIHTANDLLGTSVNSQLQLEKFAQAGVAFMASLAVPFNGMFPPTNLSFQNTDNAIILNWTKPTQTGLTGFKIYRNGNMYYNMLGTDISTFADYSISSGNTYSYYVTAVYEGEIEGESFCSNVVDITLGLYQLAYNDFENGLDGWTIQPASNTWLLGSTVNFSGNSTTYLSINSDAAGSGTHVYGYAISPALDLSGTSGVTLNFDYGYKNYTNDFFKLVYRTSSTAPWIEFVNLAPSGSFVHQSVALPEAAFVNGCQIAFYYDDNNSWAWWAAIDNVSLTGTTTIFYPPSAQNLTAVQQNGKVILNWDAASKDLIGYKIYRDGVLMDNVQNNITSWIDVNVESGNIYTYHIIAQHTSGMSAPSNQVILKVLISGINQNVINESFTIHPNPAKGVIYLSCLQQDNDKLVILRNASGVQMLNYSIQKDCSNFEIDISELPAGIYFITVVTPKQRFVSKFINLP